MPPTQKSDSEESDDSDLKAAIQMSIMDLQSSKNADSASSSRIFAQKTDFPTESNDDNDDESFKLELQRAMELSLAASGSKSDVSVGWEKYLKCQVLQFICIQ